MSLEELTKMKDIQRDELRVELQSKIDALRKTVSMLPECQSVVILTVYMQNILFGKHIILQRSCYS